MSKQIETFMGGNGFLAAIPTNEDLIKMGMIYAREFSASNIINERTVYARSESQMAGILGEIMFQNFIGEFGKQTRNYAYDFRMNNGKTVDVKCKMRSIPPTMDFEASLFEYQKYSNVDMYAFLSTVKDFSVVWFCGLAKKSDFQNNPMLKIWKAGMIDTSNNKLFHRDTMSILYKYLTRFTTPEAIA